jgi:hypothetical protein
MLARQGGLSEDALRVDIEWLEERGLVLSGLQDGQPPFVLDAGRPVPLPATGTSTSPFSHSLPHTIDDLEARSALLTAMRASWSRRPSSPR